MNFTNSLHAESGPKSKMCFWVFDKCQAEIKEKPMLGKHFDLHASAEEEKKGLLCDSCFSFSMYLLFKQKRKKKDYKNYNWSQHITAIWEDKKKYTTHIYITEKNKKEQYKAKWMLALLN